MATKSSKKAKAGFGEGWEKRDSVAAPAIVKVTWLDACSDGVSTYSLSDVRGWKEKQLFGVIMVTLGYLLEKNDNWLVLAQERKSSDNDHFRRVQDIPMYSVLELKVLEKASG
jgi:hypothetical protein